MKIDVLDDSALMVKYADGHKGLFTPNGSGEYVGEPGVFDTLVEEAGGYTLTTPSQLRFTFDSAGMLQSIADETTTR